MKGCSQALTVERFRDEHEHVRVSTQLEIRGVRSCDIQLANPSLTLVQTENRLDRRLFGHFYGCRGTLDGQRNVSLTSARLDRGAPLSAWLGDRRPGGVVEMAIGNPYE